MQSVEGRVAVVTGAASGVGLGMIRAFAAAGMRVVAADVRQGALDEAVAGARMGDEVVLAVQPDKLLAYARGPEGPPVAAALGAPARTNGSAPALSGSSSS